MNASPARHRRPLSRASHEGRPPALRDGFTLVEMLIVLGVFGILASVVLVAINPRKQLCAARNAARRVTERQVENALFQYVVDQRVIPAEAGVPVGQVNARPICRGGVADASCVNLDFLTPDFIIDIPVDDAEQDPRHTGYTVYKDTTGRTAVASTGIDPACEATTTTQGSSSSSPSTSSVFSDAPSSSPASPATSSSDASAPLPGGASPSSSAPGAPSSPPVISSSSTSAASSPPPLSSPGASSLPGTTGGAGLLF